MTNFKLRSLLESSWISWEIQYNITNIFESLTNEKKIEILDNWKTGYLPKILKMQTEADEKLRKSLLWAIAEIRKMVDEAILEEQKEKSN